MIVKNYYFINEFTSILVYLQDHLRCFFRTHIIAIIHYHPLLSESVMLHAIFGQAIPLH